MNKQFFILVLITNYSFYSSFGQSRSEQPLVTIQYSSGLSIQKFALQQWVKPAGPLFLTGAEQNPEGFGLEVPIEFYFNQLNVGVLLNPILRYDITRPVAFTGSSIKEEKSLFTDIHFTVFRKLKISKYFNQPLKVGVGYSFISPFLSYENPTPTIIPWREIKLSFEGPHILLSIPVYKFISVKQQLMYIPQGHIMYWNFSEALMYHLIFEVNLSQILSRKAK